MSKKIYLHHNNDNRYIYSLNKLGELIGKKFEYNLIVRENFVDVHIFDVFIDEFRSDLNEIHSQYPDANIFLNISSGTPAMKSALQILAAFREKKQSQSRGQG